MTTNNIQELITKYINPKSTTEHIKAIFIESVSHTLAEERK
jgi:hypothetical protein